MIHAEWERKGLLFRELVDTDLEDRLADMLRR